LLGRIDLSGHPSVLIPSYFDGTWHYETFVFQNVKNKPYSHKVTMAEHKTEQSAECVTNRININLLCI
jgi:hypothetical protein